MFVGTKIKIDKELLERVKKISELAGYASPEEFVIHCVEKELAQFEGAQSDADITEKLKGLGYIS
jgi:metal-responsive CopG/Arc/MetJ family transcriptional regulator